MPYAVFGKQKKDPAVEQLEYEVARYREDYDRLVEQAERECEERRQAIRERAEAQMRRAQDWPEALRKQITLMAREVAEEAADPEYVAEEGAWFTDATNACRKALTLWPVAQAARQAEIDELTDRLFAIQAEIRESVATQLEADNPDNSGWCHVAGALRENDPESWLDW